RSSFRHIDHDLNLRLVVKGQQLNGDGLEIEHRAGNERCYANPDQEIACRFAGIDHTVRDTGIKLPQLAAAFIMAVTTAVQGLARKADHQPRRDHDSYEKGKYHRS